MSYTEREWYREGYPTIRAEVSPVLPTSIKAGLPPKSDAKLIAELSLTLEALKKKPQNKDLAQQLAELALQVEVLKRAKLKEIDEQEREERRQHWQRVY